MADPVIPKSVTPFDTEALTADQRAARYKDAYDQVTRDYQVLDEAYRAVETQYRDADRRANALQISVTQLDQQVTYYREHLAEITSLRDRISELLDRFKMVPTFF